jgi:hypothetical protein
MKIILTIVTIPTIIAIIITTMALLSSPFHDHSIPSGNIKQIQRLLIARGNANYNTNN